MQIGLRICRLAIPKLFFGVKSQSCSCVDDSSLRIPTELGIFWAVSNLGLTLGVGPIGPPVFSPDSQACMHN